MSFEITRKGDEPDIATIILQQLQRLDAAIEKEFTLVSDRMNWMIISESFIFGAFVDAAVHYNKASTYLGYLVVALLLALPLLGILMAFFAWRAILAAHTAANDLKIVRVDFEDYFPKSLRIHLIDSKEHVNSLGNLPPVYLPPIIMLAWLVFAAIATTQLWADQSTTAKVTIAGLSFLVLTMATLTCRALVRRIHELEKLLKPQKKPAANPK